jgi:hypothetical protein
VGNKIRETQQKIYHRETKVKRSTGQYSIEQIVRTEQKRIIEV